MKLGYVDGEENVDVTLKMQIKVLHGRRTSALPVRFWISSGTSFSFLSVTSNICFNYGAWNSFVFIVEVNNV